MTRLRSKRRINIEICGDNTLCQRSHNKLQKSAEHTSAKDKTANATVTEKAYSIQFILHLKIMNPLILWFLICLQMYTFCRVIDSHTVSTITLRGSVSFHYCSNNVSPRIRSPSQFSFVIYRFLSLTTLRFLCRMHVYSPHFCFY